MQRGYPLIYLIDELDKIRTSQGQITKNLIYFKYKTGEILIKSWERIHLQYAEDKLVQYIKDEVDRGTEVAKHYLSYMGDKLAEVQNNQSKEIITEIIQYTLEKIIQFDTKDKLIKRENINLGISICLASYTNHIPSIINKSQRDKEYDRLNQLTNQIEFMSEREGISKYIRLCFKNINCVVYRLGPNNDFIPALIKVLENTIRPSRPGHSHEYLLPSLLELIGDKREIKRENRTVIVDAISNFIMGLKILDSGDSYFFDDIAHHSVINLINNLKKLIIFINDDCNWTNDLPEEKLSDLSNMIFNYFPHNITTIIYCCLIKTHLDINVILNYVSESCIQKGITLEKEINKIEEGKHLLIVPPSDSKGNQILGVIDNYLNMPNSDITDFKIKLSISHNEDGSETILTLKTKLCTYEIAKQQLDGTHGTLGLDLGVHNKFGISAHAQAINKDDFTGQISIKFLRGFKLK
ncbi:MAG: hypothetical protein KAT68_10320 [Bacteroidales bacterium]|nr:hypothetical protein [Bacteroidales bacterium]